MAMFILQQQNGLVCARDCIRDSARHCICICVFVYCICIFVFAYLHCICVLYLYQNWDELHKLPFFFYRIGSRDAYASKKCSLENILISHISVFQTGDWSIFRDVQDKKVEEAQSSSHSICKFVINKNFRAYCETLEGSMLVLARNKCEEKTLVLLFAFWMLKVSVAPRETQSKLIYILRSKMESESSNQLTMSVCNHFNFSTGIPCKDVRP